MPSLEERVALLEGRVQDQATFITMIHSASAELRQAMRELSTELRGEMAALSTELRAETATIRSEMATLGTELRAEMAAVRGETADLRREMHRGFERMDQRFGWLVGIVVTSFVATIGTIAGAFWTLLQTVR